MIAAIALAAGWNITQSKKDIILSDLALSNVEVLAQKENEEKIYRYQTWQNRECWIYVGGAYAKGKEVDCHTGTDHPICVKCTL